VPVGKVLERTVDALGLRSRLDQRRVRQAWAGIVGAGVAEHSRPLVMKHGRLTVAVPDSVWMHELSLIRHRLVGQLNSRLGRAVVREIRLTVRTPGKGRKRVEPAEDSPAAAPLTPEAEASVAALLAPVTDPACRAVLERILRREAAKKAQT
jgi:predicted nucleic acid-binding Zn ribbon protein